MLLKGINAYSELSKQYMFCLDSNLRQLALQKLLSHDHI